MSKAMNWGKIRSFDQMRTHGSEGMGKADAREDLWALSELHRRRRKPDLKSQLATKLKLSLEEQIFLGLVEPINPEKMVRRVGRKSRPGFP